jgi:hypothetical protein
LAQGQALPNVNALVFDFLNANVETVANLRKWFEQRKVARFAAEAFRINTDFFAKALMDWKQAYAGQVESGEVSPYLMDLNLVLKGCSFEMKG